MLVKHPEQGLTCGMNYMLTMVIIPAKGVCDGYTSYCGVWGSIGNSRRERNPESLGRLGFL